LLAVALLASLQSLLVAWATNKLGNRITVDMRARLFRSLQRLSIAYHDARGTADSNYSVQYDAPSVQSFAMNDSLPIASASLTLAGMITVTTYLDSQLAVIAVLVAPLLVLITVVYRRRIRRSWKTFKITESAALSVVQEVLTSLRLVKAFGREEDENEKFVTQSSQSASAAVRASVEGSVYGLLIGMATAVGLAAVLFVGIQHVLSGALSLGNLLIVNYYVTQLYSPIKTIGEKVVSMEKDLAGMERFFAIVDRQDDVPERPDALPLARATGRIAFSDVSFEYEKGHPVLKGVSFEIQPGTCLGVVGRTGSGKSTIANLLLRFFDPTEGAITLDSRDFRDYKVKDLRNQVAVVLQDTLLFSTSVAENIRFARPDASFEEVVAAAKAAEAHEFITQLPEGYDTLVGERGMLLSGGERQRISLARAFLKNAPILILDEPTSSLDMKTEAAIMKTMDGLIKGRTALLIAHRPTTVSYCDLVLVLEEGRIVEVTKEVPTIVRRMQEPDGGGQGARRE
ncbi:MAG: xenobiotic-transporting ATPase, partial [Cyanobacteria bacterium 13_1_40CM_2_61_4]